MDENAKVHSRLALGYALGAILNVLLLSGALYGLSIVSDPFFFYFSGLFLLLVACTGYLIGSMVGRRVDAEHQETNREIREQLESMQALVKANEFLETETLDLKSNRSTLLSTMEEAERFNEELQREVTERKRAEAEVVRAHNNMELILHGGDLGYWDWDVAGNRCTFNDRFASIIGMRLENLAPDTDWRSRHILPEDYHRLNRTLSLHPEGRADVNTCEYSLHRGNAEWNWVTDRGTVIQRGVQK